MLDMVACEPFQRRCRGAQMQRWTERGLSPFGNHRGIERSSESGLVGGSLPIGMRTQGFKG